MFTSVNGIALLIPRATTCWVDYRYYEALQNAVAHIAETDADSTSPATARCRNTRCRCLRSSRRCRRKRSMRQRKQRLLQHELSRACPDDGAAIRHHQGPLPTTVIGQANRLKLIIELRPRSLPRHPERASRVALAEQPLPLARPLPAHGRMPRPRSPTRFPTRRSPGFRSGGSSRTGLISA